MLNKIGLDELIRNYYHDYDHSNLFSNLGYSQRRLGEGLCYCL